MGRVRDVPADGVAGAAVFGGLAGVGSGAGPGAAGAVGALVSEFTSLRGLQSAVGELLRDLRGSPASAAVLGQERVARGQLGGGADAWGEAAAVHGACEALLRELGVFARLLDASVAAVGSTGLAARRGYESLDGEVRSQVVAAGAALGDPGAGRGAGGGAGGVVAGGSGVSGRGW
ncbi:hypothetical protein [Streptomyces triticagri]|uniref:hypothetical protein n=1 Tax=Streptomyces triticagri TaxID=2293568 RepID=UPI000FFC1B4D|nr:hypothetical protein [Streptomyces triticagri]